MSEFGPGDRVDIEIKDARVVLQRYDAGSPRITVHYGPDYWSGDTNFEFAVYMDVSAVTITKGAPIPQAGDVWRTCAGRVMQVFKQFNGSLAFYQVDGRGTEARAVDSMLRVFEGAELLFRLEEEQS